MKIMHPCIDAFTPYIQAIGFGGAYVTSVRRLRASERADAGDVGGSDEASTRVLIAHS